MFGVIAGCRDNIDQDKCEGEDPCLFASTFRENGEEMYFSDAVHSGLDHVLYLLYQYRIVIKARRH